MGLDSVELVMEVEDHFRVRLPDPECERVRTVADLAALVMARLPQGESPCPTARHFRLLRSRAVEAAGVARGAFRPSAPLGAVFPLRGRRRRWAALGREELVVPGLVAPRAVTRVFLVATVIAVLAWAVVCAVVFVPIGVFASVVLGFSTLLLVGGGLAFAYGRCMLCFPAGCGTVADLVRRTMPPVMPSAPGERSAAADAVMLRVRRLTARQLGLPLEQVRPESRFVEDLEID